VGEQGMQHPGEGALGERDFTPIKHHAARLARYAPFPLHCRLNLLEIQVLTILRADRDQEVYQGTQKPRSARIAIHWNQQKRSATTEMCDSEGLDLAFLIIADCLGALAAATGERLGEFGCELFFTQIAIAPRRRASLTSSDDAGYAPLDSACYEGGIQTPAPHSWWGWGHALPVTVS
jgi:hypothetical protein